VTERAAGNCRRKSIKYASACGLGGGASEAAQQSDFAPRVCFPKKQKQICSYCSHATIC
jgi:hypothetical protein